MFNPLRDRVHGINKKLKRVINGDLISFLWKTDISFFYYLIQVLALPDFKGIKQGAKNSCILKYRHLNLSSSLVQSGERNHIVIHIEFKHKEALTMVKA